MKPKNKNLLIIFTRNPELGKCKTRLAATIGDQKALDIYTFLLQHTVAITKGLTVTKEVHYSVKIRENDLWDPAIYSKKKQEGADLGERMQFAFATGFKAGYKNIIIIGSDMYDLHQEDLENAFKALQTSEYVLGPAEDGGYYLLGMKSLHPSVFKNKNWGTKTVLQATLKNLSAAQVKLLKEKNDIDYYEDIKGISIFQQFLN